MNFTGKNLALVRRALDLAVDDIGTQIGMCPDVVAYADDIDELEAERAALVKLAARIDAKETLK